MTKDISENVAAILAWIKTGTATVPVSDANLADTLESLVNALSTTTLVSPSTVLTGVTAGVVSPSLALVVDGNRDLATLRNVTLDGALALGVLSSLALGTLSSANDTSGVHLTASKSKALGIYADTGGAALATGNVRAGLSRFLIGTTPTAGQDISTYGHEHLLKFIASSNVGGNQAGALGHLESAGTLTLTGGANVVRSGVASFVDLAAGATVPAASIVSALGVNPANFGTLTGRSAIVHVTAPVAGAWGSLFDISGLNGLAAAAAGVTNDLFGVIYKDGVKYTFPLSRA